MAEGRGIHDIGIGGVYDNPPDPARCWKALVLPGVAAIRRSVDAVADRDIATDERLSGADPYHTVGGRCDGDRSDRGGVLFIENRCPVVAPISGTEDPPGRCTEVVRVGISRHAGYGAHAVAYGPDVPVG